MKSPYENLLEDIQYLSKRLNMCSIDHDFTGIENQISNLAEEQYSLSNMLRALRNETYPPHHIIHRIKYMDQRDSSFPILLEALRHACFNTSSMWKQSNMGIFDWLEVNK